MPNTPDITSQLRRELDDTRLRLAEAEETLNAIRNGEVDGLVVAGVAGQQVFTLQGAQEPYRLLIEQMSEGALTLSRDGVILYANQPFAKMLQMPPGRIIGVSLRDFIDPADHPALADLLEAALSRHTSEDVSVRTADGTVVLLRLGVSRLQLGEESLLCAVATDSTLERKREADMRHLSENLEARITERTTDLAASQLAILSMMEEEVESRHAAETANRNLMREITERRRSEEKMYVSELRYRRLFEAARDGVLILDAETGRVVDVNPYMLELLGVTREVFLDKKVWELGFFKDLVANEANFVKLQANQCIRYEDMALEGHDGQRHEVEFISNVYLVGDKKVIQCNIRDISDHRRSEEKMHASELRYRRLFEAAREGVLILDAETGQVVDVNPFMLELLGYSREVFLGKKVWELGFFKDLVANEAYFAELKEKEYIHYDDMALETSTGQRIEAEFFGHGYLVKDQKVLQCNIRDITEYKRQGEEARLDALELQEKNVELERFLYTASHDLKSPVVTIRSFLGYLERDMAAGDAGLITKDMDFIRTATVKMVQLLSALLDVARIGRVVSEPVNVTFRALADTVLGSVAGQITQRGVTTQVDDHAVTLWGDRLRLEEVWQNLVDNACKFMGEQKDPRIELGVETRNEETVFFVRDNGIGIAPCYQTKVFGLFEKLDQKAEGSGVGLALVKRIVEMYAGRIWVESKGAGHGSCFYFTLPSGIPKTTTGEKL